MIEDLDAMVEQRPTLRERWLLPVTGTIATAESRTQFSGVTGLTNTGLSDGFRDLYRFSDGRLLAVIEYPDSANGTLITPGAGPERSVNVRGVKGQAYPTTSTSC